MSDDRDPLLDDCGACAGIEPNTPRAIANRPGLSAIGYRVGTHGEVLHSLISALSDTHRPALAALRTRDRSDYTIALLDAFACMADVLTFYQERIANESFVRTATERASVLELARLLGYELRPGVAASTYLAFRLEQGPGAPARAPIAIGTRVQSVPGPGEVPQTFETIEAIDAAVGEWNELRARVTRRQTLTSTTTAAYLVGVATNVLVGDAMLLVDAAGTSTALRTVRAVRAEPAFERTRLEWDGAATGFTAAEVHVFRQRAALFGHNAPDWRAMPKNVQQAYLGIAEPTLPPTTIVEWPGLTIGAIAGPGLRQECFNGITLGDLRAVRVDPTLEIAGGFNPPVAGVGGNQFSARWTGSIMAPQSGSYTFTVLTDDGARLWIDGALIIESWIDQPPTEHASTAITLAAGRHAIQVEYYNNAAPSTFQLFWTRPNASRERVPQAALSTVADATVHLDAAYPKIAPQSWIALSAGGSTAAWKVQAAVEDSRSLFTISSKTTRITVAGAGLATFDERVRATVALAQSERLELSEAPDDTLVTVHVDLDRALAEVPERGRQVLVVGTAHRVGPPAFDEHVVERAIVREVVADTTGLVTRSRVIFETDLLASFVRDSVRIYGNVALATHGETVAAEVLGSGDAGRAFQKFTLRNGPLTYTPAPVPSGGESTLTVRVDGVEWTGVPALFGRGPEEQVYVTRLSDDARTTVQFGDGKLGARLPSGRENVVARLRKGLGTAGNLPAGRLTLLPARPHGVKDVLHPVPAEGGQDQQQLADARANAPRSVITLERVVSLRDHEDFARDFAGIGKALASITVRGESLGVLLTIAGLGGAPITDGSQTRLDLLDAIAAAGDRAVRVDARSYRLAGFTTRGRIAVKPAYDPDDVIARVIAALFERFSFAQRELGQPVARSEVIAAVQGVAGVEMVDLDHLAREDGEVVADRPGYLPAATPRPYEDAATAAPAELLLLAADGVDFGVMT